MIGRLDVVRFRPQVIADLGAGTGIHSAALARRYRGATVVALDVSEAMLRQARRRSTWRSKLRVLGGDMEALPLESGSVDMIFSNLTLQWCNEMDRVFAELRRVLRPGGLLMLTTFGPATLKELRASWRVVDDEHSHVNEFVDMHDIGDALLRAGMAEPVMDVEHFALTYPDVLALMRDLKALGAHNATTGRARTLTGKRKLQALASAYEAYRTEGRLPASYEVVYGHAWAPARDEAQPGQVRVSPPSAGGRRRG